MSLAIVLPFALGPKIGGQLDVHLRAVLPFVGVALVVGAFIRRERAFWPTIGLILIGFDVGLHLIAMP